MRFSYIEQWLGEAKGSAGHYHVPVPCNHPSHALAAAVVDAAVAFFKAGEALDPHGMDDAENAEMQAIRALLASLDTEKEARRVE